MVTISHVVALSNNNVIGVNNSLPWNLKTDLAHFKNYTSNKIIVMGRKTYESIGRPLPNRINLIVSNTIKEINGAELFKNTEDAINKAKELYDLFIKEYSRGLVSTSRAYQLIKEFWLIK